MRSWEFAGRLLGAFLADLNATVFGLPIALFPAINAERYGGDPRTLGLFTSAIGVGGLVSAALSGPVGRIAAQGRAMLCAVAIWGAAFAGFAIVSTLWLTLVMLAIAGAADTFTVIFRGTIVQQTTPDEFRGRVTAAELRRGIQRRPDRQPRGGNPGLADLTSHQRAHRRPDHRRGRGRHRPGAARLHPVSAEG